MENQQEQLQAVAPADEQAAAQKERRTTRMVGLLLIGIGVVMSLVFMGWPVYQAHQGADSITIMEKYAIIGLALVVFGVLGALGISIKDTNKLKITDVLILAVVAGGCIALYFWFNSYLEGLGYLQKPK